jgi:hypothetical protein
MFVNASINGSPTIILKTAAAITNGAHKAVKFDASGKAALAGAGDVAAGIILSPVPDEIKAGEEISILIKDIGLITAGAAIIPGAPVAAGAGGTGVTAADGDFILGFALTGAASAGEVIQIQITKSGFVPA